jgi:hypothetical protein
VLIEYEDVKIAHIITGLAADGAETMLYKLLGATDRRAVRTDRRLTDKGGASDRIAELGIRVLGPEEGALAALLRSRPDVLQGSLWNVRGSRRLVRDERPATPLAIRLGARLSGLPYKIVNNSAASANLHERAICVFSTADGR